MTDLNPLWRAILDWDEAPAGNRLAQVEAIRAVALKLGGPGAARYAYVKPILEGGDDETANSRALVIGAGLLLGRSLDEVIDEAIGQ